MSKRNERKEPRTNMRLPVRVFGTDDKNRPFNLIVQTVDITPVGARLRGIKHLEVGSVVQIEHQKTRARYRVVWIGGHGTEHDSHLGLECLEPAKCIWGEALPRAAAAPRPAASTPAFSARMMPAPAR
ncbi:MAG: PilZ domain-containing protein [Terriglobales bacterium]